MANNVRLSLSAAVAAAAGAQPLAVSAKAQGAVLDFVARRLEQLLIDSGIPPEAGEWVELRGVCSSAGSFAKRSRAPCAPK